MPWHYLEDGKIHGPLSEAEFALKRSDLDASTLVWADGMKEWQRLENLASARPAASVSRRHLTASRRASRPPQVAGTLGGRPEDYAQAPYAGFTIRLGAFIVDKAIFWVVLGYFLGTSTLWAGAWGGSWHYDSSSSFSNMLAPSLSGFSVALLEFCYEVVMVAEWEATLGKMLLGLHVRHNGERLTYGRSAARALAKKLSGYILGIGYFMIIWDKEKRGLHDQICTTSVSKDSFKPIKDGAILSRQRP